MSLKAGAHDLRRATVRRLRLLAVILGCSALALGCPPPSGGPIVASSPTFLGPDDFQGGWVPRAGNANVGGEATYDGRIVFSNLDREVVGEVLPPGVLLAPNTSTLGDLHPVALLFGHQLNTKWVIALGGTNFEIPVGPDYRELMLLIPFVRSSTGSNWHNYVVRMYVTDPMARDLGNIYFSYAKEDGTFQETATDFTVLKSLLPAFHASVSSAAAWQSAATVTAASVPNFAAIRSILDMPILGSNASTCSYFEMDFSAAMVRPMSSKHEFLQPFVPSMVSWAALGTIDSVVDGAIEVRGLQWRIASPPPPACKF